MQQALLMVKSRFAAYTAILFWGIIMRNKALQGLLKTMAWSTCWVHIRKCLFYKKNPKQHKNTKWFDFQIDWSCVFPQLLWMKNLDSAEAIGVKIPCFVSRQISEWVGKVSVPKTISAGVKTMINK